MFPLESKPSFHILGLTQRGRVFRPSDWAERLAGIMAQFRDPDQAKTHSSAASGPGQSSAYSPFVLPVFVAHPDRGSTVSRDAVRAVLVSGRLFEIEPLAYEFMQQFAIDNELITQGVDDLGD